MRFCLPAPPPRCFRNFPTQRARKGSNFLSFLGASLSFCARGRSAGHVQNFNCLFFIVEVQILLCLFCLLQFAVCHRLMGWCKRKPAVRDKQNKRKLPAFVTPPRFPSPAWAPFSFLEQQLQGKRAKELLPSPATALGPTCQTLLLLLPEGKLSLLSCPQPWVARPLPLAWPEGGLFCPNRPHGGGQAWLVPGPQWHEGGLAVPCLLPVAGRGNQSKEMGPCQQKPWLPSPVFIKA